MYPLLEMAGNDAQIAAVTRNGTHITVSEFAQSNSTIEALISQERVVAYVFYPWYNFVVFFALVYGNIL